MELYFRMDRIEEFLKSSDASRVKEYEDRYEIRDDIFDAIFCIDKETGKIFQHGFVGYTFHLFNAGYIECGSY